MISYKDYGNAVDAGERSAKAAHINHAALDALALALAGHNHQWTPEERKLYEDANQAYEEALKPLP